MTTESTIEKFDKANHRRSHLQTVSGEGRKQGSYEIPDDEDEPRQQTNQDWVFYREPPPLMLEDHSGLDLRAMFSSMWYYRGIFASIALILATLFVLGNEFFMPDKYEATARVRVKMLSIDDDAIAARTFSIIPTEVLSDKVLTRVINQLGMTKKETDPLIARALTAVGIEPKQTVEDGSGIMRWLRQDINIGQERQGTATAVFTVSLVDKDPENAAAIVNAIVNAYIDLRYTFETSDASEAVVFLQPKVDTAQTRVDEAHASLTKFQMENSAFLVPASAIEENIARLQREYTQSDTRMKELKELNVGLKGLLKNEPRYLSAGVIAPGVATVDSELAAMEQRLVSAEGRYVAGHPYIKQLKDEIAALQRAAKRPSRTNSANGRNPNPSWLQLSQEITANSAEYRVLKARLPDIEANIKKLTGHLANATTAQAALLTHQSAWDQAYNQYRALNDQLLEAELKADAENKEVGKDLSIMDHAVVPTLPITASRTKLQMIGLLGGIFIAFALILFYARVKNFEIPEDGYPSGTARAVILNLFGITWFLALVGYIIINPYI